MGKGLEHKTDKLKFYTAIILLLLAIVSVFDFFLKNNDLDGPSKPKEVKSEGLAHKPTQKVSMDTVVFIVPSRLSGARIEVDGVPPTLLEFLSISVKFLVPSKEGQQNVLFKTSQFECEKSLDLKNALTYTMNLTDCQKN